MLLLVFCSFKVLVLFLMVNSRDVLVCRSLCVLLPSLYLNNPNHSCRRRTLPILQIKVEYACSADISVKIFVINWNRLMQKPMVLWTDRFTLILNTYKMGQWADVYSFFKFHTISRAPYLSMGLQFTLPSKSQHSW